MHRINTKKAFFALIFPATFLFLIYVIVPMFVSLYYSLTNFKGIGVADFIGLKNYTTLFRSKNFYIALRNVFQIAFYQLVLLIPLAFMIGMLIERNFPGTTFFKTMYFTPGVISGIVAGLIWTFMWDPTIGVVNSLLRAIGLESLTQAWIGGKTLTPFSASIVGVWQGIGFHMLLMIAGLKAIPRDIYEAAEVDGASRRQQMLLITIPNMKETFRLSFVMILSGALKAYETIKMLTGGGPNHVSETLISLMYSETFTSHKYGYGMSIAVTQFIIALTLSVIFLKITNKQTTE